MAGAAIASDALKGQAVDRIKLFWMTGCTSCMRTKEFLSSHGLDFESINFAEQPERLAELKALGPSTIPVVSIGKRWTFAQDIADVAELLGMPLSHVRLSPDELVAKLVDILAVARAATLAIPDKALGDKLPNRDRSYRELVHHIFCIPKVFLDVAAGAPMLEGLTVAMEDKNMSAQQLADYGESVRQGIINWWKSETDSAGARIMKTYFGDKPMAMVLERTVWHSAQHARQLEAIVFGALRARPPQMLTAEMLRGLPMPEAVYF